MAGAATPQPGPPPSAAAPGTTEPAAAAQDNALFADLLREMAALLEAQGDNAFRVAAYRNAAQMIAAQPRSLRKVFESEGLAGLDALPTIGPGIASAIAEIVQTGRWGRLDRLRGAADIEAVFHTIPGVGMTLAHRLHDELGVDSLESLEVAARDGRLERLPQIGPRRAAAIRASLTQMLDRTRALRRTRLAPAADTGVAAKTGAATEEGPPIGLLLQVDQTYRASAEAGTLPTIAPRRFNPEGKSWLPVLHTRHGDWHFTALFSNTARAHELGRVHDWVVIYAEDRDHREHQYTVVTPPAGPLAGRRVVRGREAECRAWYASR
ncbi:MAG: DNA-binding protein [Proteobacteria bacterium]|nr:DNA-binding protein [Pseudomonadota bacterium]